MHVLKLKRTVLFYEMERLIVFDEAKFSLSKPLLRPVLRVTLKVDKDIRTI